MRLFGFKLVGLQTIGVKCPRGDHIAEVIFKPSASILSSKEARPLMLEGNKLAHPPLDLLRCDDLHFLCMQCGVSFKQCEKTKHSCQIILSEHFATIEKGGRE